jgi:hypothetical protein
MLNLNFINIEVSKECKETVIARLEYYYQELDICILKGEKIVLLDLLEIPRKKQNLNKEVYITTKDILLFFNAIDFLWKGECPPLEWVSLACVAYSADIKLDVDILCRFSRACNYYGDFHFAKKIAKEVLEDKSLLTDKLYLEAHKQLAKAYKNEGNFEVARKVLRDCLLYYNRQSTDDYVAYVLMLFGKLFNDYQQRRGWYKAYHLFAFNRMSNTHTTNKIWLQTCNEAYTKACVEDSDDVNRFYGDHIRNFPEKNDAYIRRFSHWIENRVSSLLSQNEQIAHDISVKHTVLIKYLDEYAELIYIAEKLNNIKAAAVRKVHLVRLSRNVISWVQKKDRSLMENQFHQDMIAGNSIELCNQAIKSAITISDWKTQSAAEYEKGLWIKYIFTNPDYPTMSYLDLSAEECFLNALRIIVKPKNTLAFLHHFILNELVDEYIAKKNWDRAYNYLMYSYRHCKKLVYNLNSDEAVLLEKSGESSNSCRCTEIDILNYDEKKYLSIALSQDYKVLTRRLIKVAEQLEAISVQKLSSLTVQYNELSWQARNHTIKTKVNNLRSKYLNNENVLPDIDGMKEHIEAWHQEDRRVNPRNKIELYQELLNIVETNINIKDYAEKIQIKDTTSGIYVWFNLEILNVVIENLISNIAELAGASQQDWSTDLDLKVINGVVYLIVSDDLGGFDHFLQIIKDINLYKDVASMKRNGKGKGLYLCRNLIREVDDHGHIWLLNKTNTGKELSIPLSKRILF